MQEILADAHAGLGHEAHVADVVFSVWPGGVLFLVSGIVLDIDEQVSGIADRGRVGVEEEIVLREAPIAVVAEMLGDAFTFHFQGFLRKVVTRVHGVIDGVFCKHTGQGRIADLIIDVPDRVLFTEGHQIGDFRDLFLDVDLGFDLGIIIAFVLEVVANASHGGVDLVGVEDHGWLAEALAEAVPSATLSVLHIIEGQVEQVLVGFLLDIRGQAGSVIARLIEHVHLILGQSGFILGEHLRRGASGGHHQQEQRKQQGQFSHVMQI